MSGKLLDLTDKLKQKTTETGTVSPSVALDSQTPVNIEERRAADIAREKRKIKRTILTKFIGTHVIVPGAGLQKIALYDISETGLSFDIEAKYGQFMIKDEAKIRLYLSADSYVAFDISVANVRFLEDVGMYRHGGVFLKGGLNDDALFHFVKFIETVSVTLRKDTGDVIVSNLTT